MTYVICVVKKAMRKLNVQFVAVEAPMPEARQREGKISAQTTWEGIFSVVGRAGVVFTYPGEWTPGRCESDDGHASEKDHSGTDTGLLHAAVVLDAIVSKEGE